MVLTAAAALAILTYLMRAVGAAAHERLEPSPRTQRVMDDAATLLLAGVMINSALYEGHDFAGAARLAGVAAAGVLAVGKVPLPVILVVAAAVTAGLRAAGLT